MTMTNDDSLHLRQMAMEASEDANMFAARSETFRLIAEKIDSLRAENESLRRDAERLPQSERERCARLCEMRNDEIRLMAGDLTPQELRAVQAVLANRAAAIRSGS